MFYLLKKKKFPLANATLQLTLSCVCSHARHAPTPARPRLSLYKCFLKSTIVTYIFTNAPNAPLDGPHTLPFVMTSQPIDNSAHSLTLFGPE